MQVASTILALVAAATAGIAVAGGPKDLWKARWRHIADWSWVTGSLGILATIFCVILYGRGESNKALHEVFATIVIITGVCIWLYTYAEKRE